MEVSIIRDLAILGELGVCQPHLRDDAKATVFLIACDAGGAPSAEDAVFKILKHLYQAAPFEWLFGSFDRTQRGGMMPVDESEHDLDIAPYRNFPDPEITASISDYMVRSGLVTAAWAFGTTAPAPVHVQAFDDWYSWAVSRDSLFELNSNAGKIESIASLLHTVLPPNSSGFTELERLFELIRLKWTFHEWAAHQSEIKSLEPSALFNALNLRGDVAASLTQPLAQLKRWACDFYRAEMMRAEALITKAARKIHASRIATSAVIIDFPWIDYAASLLEKEQISFLHIVPAKLIMTPILDQATSILAVAEDSEQIGLFDLFSGNKQRTRIEVMEDREKKHQKWHQGVWSLAAQALALKHEKEWDSGALSQAEQCIERALQIADDSAHPWWLKGEIRLLQRKPEEAIKFYEKAISLEPRRATYRRAKAVALERLGKKRAARNLYIYSIYLSPRDGALWSFLGMHFHSSGRRRNACYCFKKGAEYKDDAARQNYQIACHSGTTILSCPLRLLPPVIALMNRGVLRLIFEWREIGFNVSLIASLIFIVSAIIYGTVVGSLAQGVLGGVVGFFGFLLSAALLCIGAFILGAVVIALSDDLKQGKKAVILTLLSIISAIIGSSYISSFGANMVGEGWGSLGSGIGRIIGALVGIVLAFFIASLFFARVDVNSKTSAEKAFPPDSA